MILILGGAASGKRTYLASLGYLPEDIADGVLDDKKVLYGLEKLVAADPEKAQTLLPELLRFASTWRMILYGALVILIVIYRPDGLVPAKIRLPKLSKLRRKKK